MTENVKRNWTVQFLLFQLWLLSKSFCFSTHHNSENCLTNSGQLLSRLMRQGFDNSLVVIHSKGAHYNDLSQKHNTNKSLDVMVKNLKRWGSQTHSFAGTTVPCLVVVYRCNWRELLLASFSAPLTFSVNHIWPSSLRLPTLLHLIGLLSDIDLIHWGR